MISAATNDVSILVLSRGRPTSRPFSEKLSITTRCVFSLPTCLPLLTLCVMFHDTFLRSKALFSISQYTLYCLSVGLLTSVDSMLVEVLDTATHYETWRVSLVIPHPVPRVPRVVRVPLSCSPFVHGFLFPWHGEPQNLRDRRYLPRCQHLLPPDKIQFGNSSSCMFEPGREIIVLTSDTARTGRHDDHGV